MNDGSSAVETHARTHMHSHCFDLHELLVQDDCGHNKSAEVTEKNRAFKAGPMISRR